MMEAESWVSTALSKLPGGRAALQAWFGRSDDETARKVRKGLLGMIKTLTNTKIKVGSQPQPCSPRSAVMAYVKTFRYRSGKFFGGEKAPGKDGLDRYVINVCPRYWLPKFINDPQSKFGVLVHMVFGGEGGVGR